MAIKKPYCQQQTPGFFALYKLREPLAISASPEQQVSAIFNGARLAEFNLGAAEAYGVRSPESIRGKTLLELAAEMTRGDTQTVSQCLLDRLRQLIQSHYRLEELPASWTVNGCKKYFRVSYYGFVENGVMDHLLVFFRDETASHYQEELVTNIAQSLAAESGEAFFNHLVDRLVQTLEIDYALVAEKIAGGDDEVRILAFYGRDEAQYITSDAIHSLHGRLGRELFEGVSRTYPGGLQSIFPTNTYLKKYNVDSFIAVPIWGESYQQLGFIALMHSAPMPDPELVKSVLNIFSIRASAEIERRRNVEEKQRRQLQQQLFIDNSTSGMFVVDIEPAMPLDLSVHRQVQWLAEHSKFVDANPAFLKLFGFREIDHLVGRSLYSERLRYDFATTARDFVGEEFRFIDRLIRFYQDDGELWASANVSGVIKEGCLVQILGMMTDVTDRIRHSQLMEYRAKHDELTGLPNRSYFIDQVEQARRLSAPGSKHALLLLDLDGFKEVNDTLGHEIGDYLLKQIGPRFKALLSSDDSLLARLGGDEFAIFIENYETLDSITVLATALIEAIKSPFSINELELVVGGSIGIALYPDNADSVSSLMRCADVAMYRSKKESVDYRYYSMQQDHYTVRRLSLMMDIRRAIGNNELRLFYQPIVDLNTQSAVAFEALIRWDHPQLGLLSPGEFIPLIEITDMIVPVTWWVIETAIRQLAEWRRCRVNYTISVNVSTRNLIDAGFVNFIETCLKRYEVDGRYLEIEITESSLMADPEKARKLLQAAAALGCTISIDDFGTGYSSLAYLKSLPIDTLKIDRTFISQMLVDSQDRIIVNSTIQLAHNLGLNVTAEGIEEVSLVDALVELGCDKGQGFYFCRPIPVNDLQAWLQPGVPAASGEN